MPVTQVNTGQLADGGVQRLDLCTTLAGKAVIAKAIQGAGIKLNSSGTDAGTGDVTVSIDTAANASWVAQQSIAITDSETAGSTTAALTLGHNSTGTVADGFGVPLEFRSETTGTGGANDQTQGRITAIWSTVNHPTRTAYFDFGLVNNAAATASKMRLFGSGGLSVNSTSDPGAGIINANSGFRIGNAALLNKTLIGNGTNFVASTLKAVFNASTATQGIANTDTYLTGSAFTVAAGDFVVGMIYHVIIQIVKTNAAGANALVVTMRVGTAGSVSDAAAFTNNMGAQTAVATTGMLDLYYIFTAVGASAAVTQTGTISQNNASALWGFGAGLVVASVTAGSAFNSSAATKIGCSYNGGNAGQTHTVFVVKAELLRP